MGPARPAAPARRATAVQGLAGPGHVELRLSDLSRIHALAANDRKPRARDATSRRAVRSSTPAGRAQQRPYAGQDAELTLGGLGDETSPSPQKGALDATNHLSVHDRRVSGGSAAEEH